MICGCAHFSLTNDVNLCFLVVSILPKNHNNFSVDNVRVSKILVSIIWVCCAGDNVCAVQGSGVLSSETMHGMVFKREVEGNVWHQLYCVCACSCTCLHVHFTL